MRSLRVTMSIQTRSGKPTLHISLSKAVLEATGWRKGTKLELSWGEGLWRLVEGSGNGLRENGTSGSYWEHRIPIPAQERQRFFKRWGVRSTSLMGLSLSWSSGISFRRYTYQGVTKSFLVVRGKPTLRPKRKLKAGSPATTNLGSMAQLREKADARVPVDMDKG